MKTSFEAKDAIIAEYTALRNEILARVMTREKTAYIWLSILTGGLLGIIFKVNISGENTTLISDIIKGVNCLNYMTILSLLMIGYVFAVELVIAYLLYQNHMIFRLSEYIIKLDVRIRDVLNFKKDYVLFGWESGSRHGRDIDKNVGKLVKFSLFISSFLHLMIPLIMAVVGIVALFYISWWSLSKEYNFLGILNMITAAFLLMVLLLLSIVDYGLLYWINKTTGRRIKFSIKSKKTKNRTFQT